MLSILVQTPKMQAALSLQNYYNYNQVECCKITDKEGIMIAKVNGLDNKPICSDMVEAYNLTFGKGIKPSVVEKMREQVKNDLIEILRKVQGDSLWHLGINLWFNQESKVTKEGLIEQLKSQMIDDKEIMTKIIGIDAVKLLELL